MTRFAQLLVAGTATGSLYGLMALGLVLIYRSTRTLNFSHGMMATVGAFSYAILVTDWGLPAGAALVILLGIGVVSGLATYAVVGYPLARATPLARTLATILWMLVVQSVLLIVLTNTQRIVPALFSLEVVEIGGVAASKQQAGVIVFAAAAAVLLAVFLRRSRLGTVMRAVADSRESARIAGVPLLRVDAVAWALGGVMAVTAGALIGPFVLADLVNLNLLLVRVLAAALVGGLTSLPLAVGGGLVIGIGESMLQGYAPGLPQLRELLPFFVVMALLLGQSTGLLRRFGSLETSDIAPPAAGTARVGQTARKFGYRGRWLVGVGAVVVVLGPLSTGNYRAFLVGRGLVTGLVVLSLVVVTGLSGQVSLAQASFMGVGGFFGHYLAVKLGWGFWPTIPALALLGTGVALVISVPALRIRGLYLAIATWTFGLVADRVVFRWTWLASSGEGGLSGGATATLGRPHLFGISLAEDTRFALVLALITVVVVGLVRNLAKSPSGLALRTQRDAEHAAVANGLQVDRLRVAAFMFSGAVATVAGYLLLGLQSAATTQDFSQFISLTFLLMLVLGGTESYVGAVMVGVAFAFAPEVFDRLPLVQGDWQYLILGLAGIALLAATEGGWRAVISSAYQARKASNVPVPMVTTTIQAIASAGPDSGPARQSNGDTPRIRRSYTVEVGRGAHQARGNGRETEAVVVKAAEEGGGR
ncbi:MAG: ABC transporter permease [Actinomycetota bacterium]